MSRYIDADALRRETERKIKANNEYGRAVVDDEFLDLIDDAFTEDVVEVVRCKDCKYCVDLIMGGLWCEHPDNRNPLGCRPNDYCNDGERREDEP